MNSTVEKVTLPLMPVQAIMCLLGWDEDRVLAMVESGALAWAWDIRSRSAKRRDIRIWTQGLAEWRTTGSNEAIAALPISQVLERIFPHHRAEFRATELKALFCCGHQHVLNLIAEGLLIATSQPCTGPNGSPHVTRDSVAKFLTERRLL